MPAHLYDPFPKYLQIEGILRRWIGTLQLDDLLPTEEKLALKFNVSRETIRQALRTLIEEGIIARRPRVGTWVAKVPVDRSDTRLTGPFEGLATLGLPVEIASGSRGRIAAPEDVAETLRLRKGAVVYEFRRLRSFEGAPLVFFQALFPMDIGLKVARVVTPKDGLFIPALKESVGPTLHEQRQRIEAVAAGPELAALLAIGPTEPVLLVTRIFSNGDGKPVALFKSHFRADRYYYTVDLSKMRSPEAPAQKQRRRAGTRKKRANRSSAAIRQPDLAKP